jgi:predicted AAA+ superfamily ATPase
LLSDYKDIRELRDFVRLLVPRVGSMLDITKISVELGITRVKSYSYLEFLQGTYFIRLLSKFSQSIDKSIAGGKKFYFADTGLLKLIGNVNDGQLFENAVVNQLSQFGDLSFYNKRNTAEIDIILNNEKAFEVKLNATTYDYERLKKLSGKIGIKKCYLVSLNYKEIKNVIYPMFI